IARAGRKTLLIDCDLRNPAAHQLFDLPRGPGFSELIRGEATLDEVIRPTSAAGLWMITAGACNARTIRALAHEEIHTIFEQLKRQFDFVVVDSSPVLPVADALQIGQHVDAVLCSILRDVSRVPKVSAASERLMTLGIRILGAVVTGVRR